MIPPEKKNPSLGKVYNNTASAIKNKPILLVPFIIFAAVEALSLILVFLSPREPFVALFGPPIKTFWGEAYLHYPNNFFLLPKLAYLCKISLYLIFGPLVSGMCVAMIVNIRGNKRVKLNVALLSALKKYIPIFTVILLVTFLYFIFDKLSTGVLGRGLLNFIKAHQRLVAMKLGYFVAPAMVALNLVISLFIQAFFIYVIPSLIADEEKLLKAIGKSMKLFKKAFGKTLIIVGLPMLFLIPVIILNFNISFLVNNIFPESVLIFSFLSLIITSLIVEPLVSISSAFFYLESKGE